MERPCAKSEKVLQLFVPSRSEAGGIIHHTPGRSFEAWHSRSGPRSKQTADPGANMLQVVSCGVGCLLFLLHS